MTEARDDGEKREGGTLPGGPLDAVVKWYDPKKGFGFVCSEAGSPDIFIHVSTLQQYGATELPTGARVRIEVASSPKGLQASRLLRLDTSGVPAVPARRPGERSAGTGPGDARRPVPDNTFRMTGTVRWYKDEKCYGFVSASDGGQDIFLHLNVLRRSGREGVHPGEELDMTVGETSKGREALEIHGSRE